MDLVAKAERCLYDQSFREQHGISEWSEGSGPEDYGWAFPDGYRCTAYALSECETTDDLYRLGFPTEAIEAIAAIE